MHSRFTALILFLSLPVSAAILAQAPAQPGTAASASAAAAVPAPPSAILQPALNDVQNTLGALNPDKWKKGSVRDEAGEHVNTILADLQKNVPPLMAAADASPGSISRTLPLMKHIDALYDVLLRVEEASRVSAPADQISALQQTLLKLSNARLALDDQMTQQATLQEKQLVDLRTALETQQKAAAAAVASTSSKPCTPPKPVHHRKRTTTPAKSTPPPAANQQKPQ